VGLLDVVEVGELTDVGLAGGGLAGGGLADGRRARLPVEQVAELYYALSERRWSAPAAPIKPGARSHPGAGREPGSGSGLAL
jgi:hypothetical protein